MTVDLDTRQLRLLSLLESWGWDRTDGMRLAIIIAAEVFWMAGCVAAEMVQ